ncbi:hypothetical protein EBZ80_25515 [bacterium]|nr:hypothetical protein [bacterium]
MCKSQLAIESDAEEAVNVVGPFRWERHLLLEDLDPGQLVLAQLFALLGVGGIHRPKALECGLVGNVRTNGSETFRVVEKCHPIVQCVTNLDGSEGSYDSSPRQSLGLRVLTVLHCVKHLKQSIQDFAWLLHGEDVELLAIQRSRVEDWIEGM